MNEANQFSIDIKAETQAISSSLDEQVLTPSDIINIQSSPPLAERALFQATEVDLSSTIKAESSKITGLDFMVKVDTEELQKQTENLEQSMNEMYGGFKDIYDYIKGDWIPNREKNDFEERPTIEANNLIFYARRDKMSMAPYWA
jgi:hypothetical protein